MKRVLVALSVAAAMAVTVTAQANEKLAQSSGCMTCHGVDKKVIGPSYKEIAQKYRADKGAQAALEKKVKSGGKGVWGETPMPPNAHVKDEDIKTVVAWILGTK